MARSSWADFGTDLSDDQRGAAFSGLLLPGDVDSRRRLVAPLPALRSPRWEVPAAQAREEWLVLVAEKTEGDSASEPGVAVGIVFEPTTSDELSPEDRRRIVDQIARGEGVAAAHVVTAAAASQESWCWPPAIALLGDDADDVLARELPGLNGAELVRLDSESASISKVEILVLSGALPQAIEAVKKAPQLPRVQAALVLGGRGDGDSVTLSEELRERARADAIVVLDVPPEQRRPFLEALLRELERDRDLDVAVTAVARELGLERPLLIAAHEGFARAHRSAWGARSTDVRSTIVQKLGRHAVLLTTLGLAAFAAFLRSFRLSDILHADSGYWLARTDAFWRALGNGDFAGTYATPHPGVTYMWLHGAFARLLGANAAVRDHTLITAAKLPAITVGTLAAALTFPLLVSILGKRSWPLALLISLLLCTEPYLVIQSRIAHLDMVALGFTWIGLLFLFLSYRRERPWFAALAGMSFGLGCLTKFTMVAIAGTGLALLGFFFLRTRFRDRLALKVGAIAGLSVLVTVFAAWPTLWVRPIGTVELLVQGTAKEVERHHQSILYYVDFLSRNTPYEIGLLLLPGVAFLVTERRNKAELVWLLAAFVPYALIIAIAPKRLTRYLLPLFAIAVVPAAVAAMTLIQRARQRYRFPWIYPAAVLAALLFWRTDRALADSYEGRSCTSWPWVSCIPWEHPGYAKELAVAIEKDWKKRGRRRKAPTVYANQDGVLRDVLEARWVDRSEDAQYAVIWRPDQEEARETWEQLRLLRAGETKLAVVYRVPFELNKQKQQEQKKKKKKKKKRRAGR